MPAVEVSDVEGDDRAEAVPHDRNGVAGLHIGGDGIEHALSDLVPLDSGLVDKAVAHGGDHLGAYLVEPDELEGVIRGRVQPPSLRPVGGQHMVFLSLTDIRAVDGREGDYRIDLVIWGVGWKHSIGL